MQSPTEDQLAAWKRLQWASAVIMSRFRRDLAESGLSLEQIDALVHLAWAPDGSLPLHQLTASMVVADALSRSGITRLLGPVTNPARGPHRTRGQRRRRDPLSITDMASM